MKKNIRFYALMIVMSAVFGSSLFAQAQVSKGSIESVLSRFSNYRYGTVSIWRFKNEDRDKIREAIKEYLVAESGEEDVSDELLKGVDPRIIQKTEECVRGGTPNENCFEDIEASFNDVKLPTWNEYVKIFEAVRKKVIGGGGPRPIKSAYLVTTRGSADFRGTIIAMIVSTQDDYIDINLESPNSRDIYVTDEMKLVTMTDVAEPNLTNVYELAQRRLAQGNLINATLDAQGIGNINWFGQRNFGKTVSLFKNESDLSPEDIQRVKQISEKQPHDQYLKENELIVGLDLISWKNYEIPLYDDGTGNLILDTYFIVNSRLPRYGVELKYGIDEINFTSLWSERMTLSAIWDRVKLGVILPTNGWSSISSDWFKQDRKLTHGGFGIAAEADFPFKVIPKSGVFHGSIAYVAGDAKNSDYKNRNLNIDEFKFKPDDFDHLVRFNAQLHYTFAVAIDQDYLFRFGIGGTMYTIERWLNYIDSSNVEDGPKIGYKNESKETIGGISGRVDFMAKNITTPYGASLQYFDEGLGMNLWLQIPIVANTFSVQLDAKGYYKAFKDSPRAWENRSVFIPMARFIVYF